MVLAISRPSGLNAVKFHSGSSWPGWGGPLGCHEPTSQSWYSLELVASQRPSGLNATTVLPGAGKLRSKSPDRASQIFTSELSHEAVATQWPSGLIAMRSTQG